MDAYILVNAKKKIWKKYIKGITEFPPRERVLNDNLGVVVT